MNLNRLRRKIFIIIFGTQTPAGKWFDIILTWTILLSVVVAMVLSIPGVDERLKFVEWGFTVIFTVEYLLRIWAVPVRFNYIKSFWGFIDLISVLPTYLSLIYPDAHFLMVIRVIRILRIFNILKLSRFMAEARNIYKAMYASRYKIMVFISVVVVSIIILGTLILVWPPIVRTKLVKVRQKYYFLHQFCMRFESKNLQEGQRSILVSVL